MAKTRIGMGRGLEAILSVADTSQSEEQLRQLPVELIVPNPNQPRRSFDREALDALAGSLAERGVLQPVLVRPLADGRYELVAGERRWRAAQIAGLSEVPALVRARDDAAAIELALIENMARQDLNPIEEARACEALVDELGLSREQVARRVGRHRAALSNLIRLLDLPDEAIHLIELRRLSEGHGRALLLAGDQADRRRLAREAVQHGWSVRLAEERAREANGSARNRTPRPTGSGLHPDQEEVMSTIADALSRALGSEVRVRAAGSGYRAELTFATPHEALELAERLGGSGR